jgi:hypothetical protein
MAFFWLLDKREAIKEEDKTCKYNQLWANETVEALPELSFLKETSFLHYPTMIQQTISERLESEEYQYIGVILTSEVFD